MISLSIVDPDQSPMKQLVGRNPEDQPERRGVDVKPILLAFSVFDAPVPFHSRHYGKMSVHARPSSPQYPLLASPSMTADPSDLHWTIYRELCPRRLSLQCSYPENVLHNRSSQMGLGGGRAGCRHGGTRVSSSQARIPTVFSERYERRTSNCSPPSSESSSKHPSLSLWLAIAQVR